MQILWHHQCFISRVLEYMSNVVTKWARARSVNLLVKNIAYLNQLVKNITLFKSIGSKYYLIKSIC